MLIVHQESANINIKSVVLHLGALHLEMCFLDVIGHLIAGLKETLEIVYADNAVIHMLSGKAIAWVTCDPFLMDVPLNAWLVPDVYDIPLTPTTYNTQERVEYTDENDHQTIHTGRRGSTRNNCTIGKCTSESDGQNKFRGSWEADGKQYI